MAGDPFAPQEHGVMCPSCRDKRLTMHCAACGRPTAVVTLASAHCHVEWCASCWQTLLGLRDTTQSLPFWPVAEYVQLQTHRELKSERGSASPAAKRAHRRTRHDPVNAQRPLWGVEREGVA